MAVLAVPAAPLLLPAASPAQPAGAADAVAALRADVMTAISGLPEVDAVVLLAGASEPLVYDAREATLASYGLPRARADIVVDGSLLAAVSARGQAPRVRSDRLDGDLAVLALLIADRWPGMPLVPVSVAAAADVSSLGAVAAGIVGAADAVGRDVAVVAASDLAATLDETSPGYLVDGAADWDAAAVDAVRTEDVTGMAALGPAEAARVQARGWAPLTVLLHVADQSGASITRVDYHAPRGVGQLVAR